MPEDNPLELAKDRVTATLTDLYAEDRIRTERLEELLARVHAATTAPEVYRVLASATGQPGRPAPPSATRDRLRPLPAPASPTPASPAPASPDPSTVPAVRGEPEGRTALASPEEVRDNDVVLAYQDGAARSGVWTPARHVWVLNTMGGTELDFREARFGPGVTEVSVFSFLGGVQVVVPPGLQVEFRGRAMLGAFEMGEGARAVDDPAAPVLRINGVSILAGVDVSVRRPGETERQAKKRRRQGELPPGPGGPGDHERREP